MRADRRSRRYRLNVAARAAAAVVGGYAIAALVTMALARAWPGDRVQGAVAAMLVAFPVWAAAAVWAFLARSPTRAWAGLIAFGAAAGLLALVLGPHA